MKPFWVLLVLLVPNFCFSAPDEAALGKAEGYPVCPFPKSPSPTPQNCLVGVNSHHDQIAAARKVAKGATVMPLKRADKEPGVVDFNRYLDSNRNTGLLVLKDDTILLERYQYDRKPEHRFASHSMAKTVVAMLVGIALSEGKIGSIDDRADKYVPELKGHPYGETSLRHLLTMSSGVRYREDYDGNDDAAVLIGKTFYHQGPGGADNVMSFRDRRRAPGTGFYYSSAETAVLGLALRSAVGKPIAEYLSEKIWQPMGAESDASWLVDAGGYEFGFAGLNATLRDWARFGMLLANGGAINGKQLIPAAWVKAATQPESAHLMPGRANPYLGYGYQTWLVPGVRPTFGAFGARGQGVFVDPVTKLVVVHTAVHARPRDPARESQFSLWNALLRSYSD